MKWLTALNYPPPKIALAALLGTSLVCWSYVTNIQASQDALLERERSQALMVVTTTYYPEEKTLTPATLEELDVVSDGVNAALTETYLSESSLLSLTEEQEESIQSVKKDPEHTYVEVTDSCGPYYQEECVNIRSGPGTEYSVVGQLREGAVLKVIELLFVEDGTGWYQIMFDEWLRYPARQRGTWYISADFVREFNDVGEVHLDNKTPPNQKHVTIDRTKQMLYAYDGDELFMEEIISTGRELAPTPRGTFSVFKMTPTRYMQGPIPGITEKEYDLPGVPWAIYFTVEGAAIHGAYWHDNFGTPWSNGCVNLPPEQARKLYEWAELGMEVTVRD